MSLPTDPSRPTPAGEPPALDAQTQEPAPQDPEATAAFLSGRIGPFPDAQPHARGGLGEVFRATDPTLHRTVAVKRLQAHRSTDPSSLRRFLVEAEVTARLEHPGVVPVYALYPDA